jgi:prepilin peptidase CpaA
MLSGTDALIFLPFVLAISVWVAWSDMKTMKIPNKAVLALAATFFVIGFFLLPLYDWLWALALLGIVLAVGFVMSTLTMIGAGDAKFAAAMAPFFVGADIRLVLGLFAACLIGAFVAHRTMKHIPAFRAATPDWLSWTRRDFPMGLALTGALVIYLVNLVRIDFAA